MSIPVSNHRIPLLPAQPVGTGKASGKGLNHYEKKNIISGVSTVLCTALVWGSVHVVEKLTLHQTIPAVNDTVKETAKDRCFRCFQGLDAVSEKDASTKQIYDDRLITDAASLERPF